ncbi:MAG: acyltransferase [Gammaproteobacteria bacterium]|nr:acyltransferase [Gammaproteobacteria bacterium]
MAANGLKFCDDLFCPVGIFDGIYLLGRYELSWNGTVNFYKNRFLRIAPLLYFNLLIIMALTGRWMPILGHPAFFGDIFFVNNITGQVINPVTWSISYEMQDYMLCPLFFWLFHRYGQRNLMLLLSVILVMGFYAYLAQSNQEIILFKLFQFTWLFLAGFFANYLIRLLHEEWNLKGSGVLRFLGFVCFVSENICHWILYNAGKEFLAEVVLCVFAISSIVKWSNETGHLVKG